MEIHGRNILGTPESVDQLSREDILEFRSRTYTANRIKIAAVGPFGLERIESMTEGFFGHWTPKYSNWTANEKVAIKDNELSVLSLNFKITL